MTNRFYTARAVHSRHGLSAPHSTFVGELPLARVELPMAREHAVTFETERGQVSPSDRKLVSVVDVRAYCREHDAPTPYRVELLTPPRRQGQRFAAMAVYLLYVDPTRRGPTHFILEAGMATGEAVVCYPPTRVGAWQTVEAGYRPTHFSTGGQRFRGTFSTRGDAPNEPAQLVIEAYRAAGDKVPAIRIVADYVADEVSERGAHPLALRVVAGARIHAIASAMQMPIRLAFRPLLSLISSFLTWLEAPQRPSVPLLPAPLPRHSRPSMP